MAPARMRFGNGFEHGSLQMRLTQNNFLSPAKDSRPCLAKPPGYSYCIQLDAAALNSVVNAAPKPPEPDLEGIGYVNLIDPRWEMEMPDPAKLDYEGSGLDSKTYDPTDERGPEVEGCMSQAGQVSRFAISAPRP